MNQSLIIGMLGLLLIKKRKTVHVDWIIKGFTDKLYIFQLLICTTTSPLTGLTPVIITFGIYILLKIFKLTRKYDSKSK